MSTSPSFSAISTVEALPVHCTSFDARRLQAKQITHCPELPGTTKALIHDVLAKPQKRIALIVGRDRARRYKRGRVRHFGLLAATEFNPTRNAVKVVDRPRRLHA